MKNFIKQLLKKTPIYGAVFRYRHYKNHILPDHKYLYSLYLQEFKVRYANKWLTKKPKVINLNANDICNSKCTMCNIWQQKQEYEVTPSELKRVLSDPLFSEIEHIGITGGEPTLREDLPQLYEAVMDAIPTIQGLSIITNAIRKEDVINRIEKSIEVVHKRNKFFSMMVSVDGFGGVHDRIRGREGNFETAMSVIRHFMAKGIPVSIGSTISKGNVWDAEELLYFMRKEGLYGRFRVAEFIKRLYNDDRSEVIRNFSEDETYQLTIFFYKLIYAFETDPKYKRTYLSIIDVLNGKKRRIGCPYQTEGVVLNSRAELAYCAPKSPIIGNTRTKSALKIYESQMATRENIIAKNCDDCIHDYHYDITLNEFKEQQEEAYWKEQINVHNPSLQPGIKDGKRKFSYLSNTATKAFIMGWYGTETVGDKAILAGIILDLKKKYGDKLQIVIGSIFPYITHRTVKELALDAIVVPSYGLEMIENAKHSDITIMGGGPLMDLDDLAIPLHAFRVAHKHGKQTIVYGCGIGPLYEEHNRNVVKEILSLSSEIRLRDNGSMKLAKEYGFANATLSGDYARYYLQNAQWSSTVENQNVMSCYLREWTYEYSKDLSHEQFLELKERFETGIAEYIVAKAKEMGVKEVLLQNMHNFVIGNDDRDFSRYFIEKYFKGVSEINITFDNKLATVDSIVHAMRSSKHNICMRFHSVLFAQTLNVPFTAIDYTKGGKIRNYLMDNNASEHMMTVEDFSSKQYSPL